MTKAEPIHLIGLPKKHRLDQDHFEDVEVTSPSDGEVLTYDEASGKWKNQAPSGGNGGGAHADTHYCGGSDALTGVLCPSGLKHPDTYQIILDKRGTNVPCLRPQYNGYGDLGKYNYKWAYIYADYLGTSDYRITNAYLNNLRVYSNARIYSLFTRDIYVEQSYTIQLPHNAGGDAYMMPYTSGHSYVGTSSSYFREMHATDFITHSFKPITTKALDALLRIDLADKATFPEDTVRLPATEKGSHDYETVRRRLRDELKREPKHEEILAELSKPCYKGVNLVQLCGYLIEAIKELTAKVTDLESKLSSRKVSDAPNR